MKRRTHLVFVASQFVRMLRDIPMYVGFSLSAHLVTFNNVFFLFIGVAPFRVTSRSDCYDLFFGLLVCVGRVVLAACLLGPFDCVVYLYKNKRAACVICGNQLLHTRFIMEL